MPDESIASDTPQTMVVVMRDGIESTIPLAQYIAELESK